MTILQGPVREPVHQGPLKTPFYPRVEKLDIVNQWHEWKGYSSPDALYSEEQEYFAIRNGTGVFDLSPMTKYRITGPDALDYLNRLVTRDMAKVGLGRVAYAVWCDDQGQVIDDGTIFHLREGEYRLCCQERHFAWFQAATIGFDVSVVHETEDVCGLAVQGPTSYSVLKTMGVEGLEELKPFGLIHVDFQGTELMVSRTGFTADLGYEIWIDPDKAYLGLNYVTQGCAADLIKRAINAVFEILLELRETHEGPQPLYIDNLVHDEIILEVREDLLTPALAGRIRTAVTTHVKPDGSPLYNVPITAGVEIAEHDWGHTVAYTTD